jgi:hypothetical protein
MRIFNRWRRSKLAVELVKIEVPELAEAPARRVPVITRTHDGYPMGKALDLPDDWLLLIDPLANAKLNAWYAGSTGLEVSGYALLSQPVDADPQKPGIFYIEDVLLICTIEESSGGYTEMSPEQRAQAMMEARKRGYKANQLAWWHKHPIPGWSGTDTNTMRQRVHELGLPEVLQAFSFVMTPHGIRARWDRSGPNEGDNVYIDQIPVSVGTPSLLVVAAKAGEEVKTLLAKRAPKNSARAPKNGANGTNGTHVDVPRATWKKPPMRILSDVTEWYEEDLWGEDADDRVAEEALEIVVLEALVKEKLAVNEDPEAFVCRQDPTTLVSAQTCASCPLLNRCFTVTQGDINDAVRRWWE